MNNKLLKVSIILITWNVERTLPRVLRSIEKQNYPLNLIQTIAVDGNSTDKTLKILEHSILNIKVIQSPYPKDPEACRGVGLKYAKNEIVCFIDADNILPNKEWLVKMITPFIQNKDIVGSETWRFAYLKNDNYLNRYFALIGSADPVGLYLGKADKLSYISDKWVLFGEKIRDYKDYFVIDLNPKMFPTLGSNGFCARRELLIKAKSDPEHYFHIDVPLDLAKKGYTKYAVVKETIIHDTATTLYKFLSKRVSYMKLHYQKRAGVRRYKVFDPKNSTDKFRLTLFIFFSLTFFQPTYVALKGYIKKPDIVWFVHPIFCFFITLSYAYAVISKKLSNIL